ncbi:MAG TPA: EamA family transporter [Candidatus Dormibacteraeota bacterium]
MKRADLVKVAVALPVVWVTIGSAFVALKMGVANVPPFLFSGSRFLIVGALLLAWCAWRVQGRLALRRVDLLIAAATGAGMIMAGQGGASWASQYLDPGIVAVLSSTMPIWAVVLSVALVHARPAPLAMIGLVAGFGGVALLAWPTGGSGIAFLPALVTAIGAVGWGAGSLLVSRSELTRRPVLMTALQMLVGGGLQFALGLVGGEAGALSAPHLAAALPVFAYLIVVPGLVGFPLLTWLFSKVELQIVNTTAYVVPVVALLLGWLILGDAITLRTLVCVVVTLVGVSLIVFSSRRRTTQPRTQAAELAEEAA